MVSFKFRGLKLLHLSHKTHPTHGAPILEHLSLLSCFRYSRKCNRTPTFQYSKGGLLQKHLKPTHWDSRKHLHRIKQKYPFFSNSNLLLLSNERQLISLPAPRTDLLHLDRKQPRKIRPQPYRCSTLHPNLLILRNLTYTPGLGRLICLFLQLKSQLLQNIR